MQNIQVWKESKFCLDKRGRWRSCRKNVPVSSRLIVDRIADAYVEMITKHASGRLVDLGCGNVPLYGMYKNLVDDVVCVDWKDTLHSAIHVDIFADLNSELDLETATFDTVIATDVIEHIYEPKIFFANAACALRSRGKIIIGVPFFYWIHEIPNDFHRYTRFSLERMARDAGLTIIELKEYGGAPEILSDIIIKSLRRWQWLATLIYQCARTIVDLPPVRKISRKTAITMPLGYVMVAQKGD